MQNKAEDAGILTYSEDAGILTYSEDDNEVMQNFTQQMLKCFI